MHDYDRRRRHNNDDGHDNDDNDNGVSGRHSARRQGKQSRASAAPSATANTNERLSRAPDYKLIRSAAEIARTPAPNRRECARLSSGTL
jgi:hypothetical protein